ncbi:MAG TPA: helix-turn-helix domain-containing protein [Solirubrobacterales bacterium]
MAADGSNLAGRLRERLPEIEQAILTRAYAVSDPSLAGDPDYVTGLRTAVSAAVGYALAAMVNRGRHEAIPATLLEQARHAARAGVPLDTVLRRYIAGYTLLGDFIVEEIERDGSLRPVDLQRLLRAEAALLDRVITAIADEYTAEVQRRSRSSERRRVEAVEKLLDSELVDTTPLDYDLDGWHIAALVSGPAAEPALRQLARDLDRRLLLISHDETTTWAWFGGRRRIECSDLARRAERTWPDGPFLVLGEPGQGLSGWRLTHQQAAAALPVALRRSSKVVRYADVGLLASALQDEVLVRSLKHLYLEPLAEERDGGETLRETLRAYFAAEGNVSSAAAALGVTRQTVTNRLRVAEARIGRGVDTCGAELRAALGLQRLGAAAGGRPASF